MPIYKDIFNLNLKYIEYLLAKTSLTQGYIHNIGVTGSEIEQEVRRLLRNLLPQRFHITHGYIISAASQEEEWVYEIVVGKRAKRFRLEKTRESSFRWPRPAHGLSRLTGDEHASNFPITSGRITYAALEIVKFIITIKGILYKRQVFCL